MRIKVSKKEYFYTAGIWKVIGSSRWFLIIKHKDEEHSLGKKHLQCSIQEGTMTVL